MTKRRTIPLAHGFTLVEILCVVVIVGIAAAVVVPQLAARDDLKVAAAGRAVMADLIYAQNRAITYQKAHYVRFETDTSRYTLLSAPGLTLIQHPANKTDYIVRFGTGGIGSLEQTSLVSAAFRGADSVDRTVLAFDELGTPLAYNTTDGSTQPLTSGQILLQSGSHKLQISIEPFTGQLSAQNVE